MIEAGPPTASLTGARPQVLPCGMTTTVSIKIPARLLERLPRAGQGRSGFILQALEEKLARQAPPEWKPTTRRGRRLAALLAQGRKERDPLLNEEALQRELRERRGRLT